MRMTISAGTFALTLALSVVTPGCTDRRSPDRNDVDVNAAAAMAEQDIANYAAERRSRWHRPADPRRLAAPAAP